MIAMQYSFVLPADYDMGIIDQRIRDKGPMLDGFPHLRFKAYLSARRQDEGFASTENLYAPFYVWDEAEGLNNFLCGPGFAAPTKDYGWPSVKTWMVWQAELGADLGAARFASREVMPIPPHADLAAYRREASEMARADAGGGALAAVAAFDPDAWTMVQFRLWRALPEVRGRQVYRVGHVSLP
jgi:hypothetical protein